MVEYPGYSLYKENKDSDKILEDSLTIYDYLVNEMKVAYNNIFVFGRSIGSGPALFLSSKRKIGGLMLLSPFTSIQAVAENLVGGLLKFLVSER